MGKTIRVDLTGRTFGSLTVICRDEESSLKQDRSFWFCKCECDESKIISVNGKYLTNGHVSSCGCLRAAKPNRYEVYDKNTVVMWTTNTNESFYISAEDLDLVKSISWRDDMSRAPGHGYIVSKVNGVVIRLHRYILGLPVDSALIGDHRDGDTYNNRRTNLRSCTFQQNIWNQGLRSTNTSGKQGVKWNSSSWRWEVFIQGKYIDCFFDYNDAVKVREKLEQEIYGEFRRQ